MRFDTLLKGFLPATLISSAAAYPTANSTYTDGGKNSSCAAPPVKGSSCHGPDNRACWTKKPDFDINTDWEEKTPYTGVTRKYHFILEEIDNYVGADGVTKQKAMLVNGQFPGPTITADWGDFVIVEVESRLQNNGSGIHWHGLRQFENAIHDGTPGIAECPIPPGGKKEYKFHVTQYGTSWYHGHVSAQYAYGVTGAIVFNGPSSANYDVDLGPLHISDWYYATADHIVERMGDPTNPFLPGLPGSPPPSDNVFFNGKNINPIGSGGEYQKMQLTPGKKHLLRLINPSVDNTFTVSVVGHEMQVVETDFVSVTPVTVNELYMGVGQRYDVIIDANQAVGNYWLNVTFSSALVCGGSVNTAPAMILSYDGADSGLPTEQGSKPADSFCADSLAWNPIVERTAPSTEFTGAADETLDVTMIVDQNVSKVFWTVNASHIVVDWEKPILQSVGEGVTDFAVSENIIKLPDANEWAFWIINNVAPIPHPMHLHGHDFVILGQSSSLENPLDPSAAPRPFTSADAASLKFDNPTRRDTTILPGFGWLAVAFKTDNPGSWPFHCHIAWHVSQGLAVNFLERASEIPDVMDLSVINGNCDAWNAYIPTNVFQQTDSGL